jgi:hypothetical protein
MKIEKCNCRECNNNASEFSIYCSKICSHREGYLKTLDRIGKTSKMDKNRREKQRIKRIGKKHSQATKDKIRLKHLGKKLTDEHKKNIRESCLNHPESIRTRFKVGGNMGINNSNWKNGISKIHKTLRNYIWSTHKYITWRKANLQRDKFTCQLCSKTNCKLNVHHIIPFSNLLDKYNLSTIEEVEQSDELWDVSNGITLCLNCHKKIHSKNNHQEDELGI